VASPAAAGCDCRGLLASIFAVSRQATSSGAPAKAPTTQVAVMPALMRRRLHGPHQLNPSLRRCAKLAQERAGTIIAHVGGVTRGARQSELRPNSRESFPPRKRALARESLFEVQFSTGLTVTGSASISFEVALQAEPVAYNPQFFAFGRQL